MNKKKYRFLTGLDNAEFCQRVSDALDDGYLLYGSPVIATRGDDIIVGQALTLDPTRKTQADNDKP